MATRAADIMSKDVTVIREQESVREAAERLAKDDIGVLPITWGSSLNRRWQRSSR